MSTLGLNDKLLAKAANVSRRIPRVVRVSAAYILVAAVLTPILLAHSIPPLDWARIGGVFLLCLLGTGLAAFHIGHMGSAAVSPATSQRILWMTAILALAGVQLGTHALATEGISQLGVAFLAVAPIVAMGMLVSGLLGPAMAIFAVTMVVLGGAVTQVADPVLLAGAWLASAAGAHAVNPLRKRNDLFRAIYYTTAAFAVAALGLSLYLGSGIEQTLLTIGWAAIGGVGATALFWLAIAAFERAFGVVSDWSLLELCSPEQPLLRDLVLKAPGTYAHSVMVGNLSENAARAIGANTLLCRAMAYYHDIGKLKRPEFFIENKRNENPHDRLSPSLSAKIIGAHVREGTEMAELHNLPKPIRDGIEQHHGTSLISYFYHLATRHMDLHDPILEQHFRYPGPRPRSKETAILMLADRVEAATRTLPRQTPGRLRSYIWEIVQDVRDDGQLDDSELNFHDLQVIVNSFVGTIGAINHERIEYPGGVNLDALIEEASNPGNEPGFAAAEAPQPEDGPRSDA